MTDYTEVDAAAEIVTVAKLAGAEPAVLRIIRAVLVERDQLRTENARLAADLAAARAERDAAVAKWEDLKRHYTADTGDIERERDRMREALAWAVGFIRCNLPNTSAGYEDMRNAEDLVKGVSMCGEFHRLSCRAEVAESQLAEARQAAADWRGLLACGWEEAEHVAHFIAWHHDEDCRREIPRHFAALNERAGMPAEVRDAARRLAAPHLNPPAEGGAK